jgi:hypothetical protein
MPNEYLHGWPRTGAGVLIGTGVHCAGCGRFRGLACVGFEAGWTPPASLPDWPFPEADCPLCTAPVLTLESVAALSLETLRKAITIAKARTK